ncbi:MAG TPA: hypothetical protein VFS00_31550, partial [Polyangiaceae bacterium]|nr:hypothetical protein [Polyangiaceae bacterium]
CSKQGPVAFCADFDGADPFGIGGRGWDEVSNVATGLAIAANQSVSTPNALRVASSLGVERPSLMKTALLEGGAPIVSATLDYDLFVESLPKAEGAGVGLVDFQFAEADDFGFRLVLEANADGSAKDLRLEHNSPGGTTVVRPPLASLPPQAWTHVHCEAFFTPGKPNRAALRVYFGGADTPAVDESFDAPFGFAGLARVRVLPFHFAGGAPNPGALSYGLYFDNVSMVTVGVPPELGRPGGARR